MTTLAEKMYQLSEERRRGVEERSVALIAEEMSLRELRKARQRRNKRPA